MSLYVPKTSAERVALGKVVELIGSRIVRCNINLRLRWAPERKPALRLSYLNIETLWQE